MRNLFLPALLFCFVAFSCKDDERPKEPVVGNWELVKSIGSYEGAVREGDELEAAETYSFRPDGTFVKRREMGETVYQGAGKYTVRAAEVEDSSNVQYYLELIFESGDPVHGDCYSERAVEYLIVTWQGQLKNTWGACDGPILFYQKK